MVVGEDVECRGAGGGVEDVSKTGEFRVYLCLSSVRNWL